MRPFLMAMAPPGMPIADEKYKTWLMHCWLEVGDQALMGADMDVGWARNIDKPKNGFDVTLHTEDKAQGQRWFDDLSEGGRARHAVQRDVLVARLWLPCRQVRDSLDGQHHSTCRMAACAGLSRSSRAPAKGLKPDAGACHPASFRVSARAGWRKRRPGTRSVVRIWNACFEPLDPVVGCLRWKDNVNGRQSE